MIQLYKWQERWIYASFILNGQYVSVLASYTSFNDVLSFLKDENYELSNLVLVSALELSEREVVFMQDNEIATFEIGVN